MKQSYLQYLINVILIQLPSGKIHFLGSPPTFCSVTHDASLKIKRSLLSKPQMNPESHAETGHCYNWLFNMLVLLPLISIYSQLFLHKQESILISFLKMPLLFSFEIYATVSQTFYYVCFVPILNYYRLCLNTLRCLMRTNTKQIMLHIKFDLPCKHAFTFKYSIYHYAIGPDIIAGMMKRNLAILSEFRKTISLLQHR